MAPITVTMQHQKSTKNTEVYNDAPDSAVPTLYIRKSDLPSPPPARIKLTIEVA